MIKKKSSIHFWTRLELRVGDMKSRESRESPDVCTQAPRLLLGWSTRLPVFLNVLRSSAAVRNRCVTRSPCLPFKVHRMYKNGYVQVLVRLQGCASDPLGSPYRILKLPYVWFAGWTKPLKRFSDLWWVEVYEQLLRQVELPESAEEVRPVLGFFHCGVSVGALLHVPWDCKAQEPWGTPRLSPCLLCSAFFLKSIVISTVLSMFGSRMFWQHEAANCSTSSL